MGQRLKHEVADVLSQHLTSNGQLPIQVIGETTELTKKVITLLKEPVQTYEVPDSYFRYDNITMFVEHFQFDGSCRPDGSLSPSKGRNVQEEVKYFDRKAMKAHYEGKEFYSATLQSGVSLPAYQNSLLRSFRKHRGRIPNYVDNITRHCSLSSQDRLIKGFLIEDASVFPSTVHGVRGKRLLLPIMLSAFLDEVFSSDLDVIFMTSRADSSLPLYYWERGTPVGMDILLRPQEMIINIQPHLLSYIQKVST